MEQKGRLCFLQKMMYHAGKFEWAALLDLYAAVIKAIEFGEKTWDDNFQEIEHMVLGMRQGLMGVKVENVMSIQGHFNGSSRSGGDRKKSQNGQKVLFCADYQKGECKEAEVHQTTLWHKQVMVWHVCATCLLKDNELRSHQQNSACCPHLNVQ